MLEQTKQAAEEIEKYRSEHRRLSTEISKLTVERLSLETQNWAGNAPEQAASLRLKRWTISDALLSLEEQRGKVEDRIKSLLRLQHQARKIESDLADGGHYDLQIGAAEEDLNYWIGRREVALLHLEEIGRQIDVIAQAGTAQNGQAGEQVS